MWTVLISRRVREKKGVVMFKEKSGVEVLILGKRIIVYDGNANIVDKAKLSSYAWDVKAK